jgi:hypothetical protein
MTRVISDREREILAGFAAAWAAVDPDAAAPLQRQLALVEGATGDMSTYYDYRVPPPYPAIHPDGPIPVEVDVVDQSGEPVGLLLLWVKGGALGFLEHAWYLDEMPTELPPIELVKFGSPLATP